jgi:hypothetical protein
LLPNSMRNFEPIPPGRGAEAINILRQLRFLKAEHAEPRYHGIAGRYSYAVRGGTRTYTFHAGVMKIFEREEQIAETKFSIDGAMRDENCILFSNNATGVPIAVFYRDGGIIDRREWKRYTHTRWEKARKRYPPASSPKRVLPPQVHRLTSDDIKKSHALLRSKRETAVHHYIETGRLSDIEIINRSLTFYESPLYAHMSILERLLAHPEVSPSEKEALKNSFNAGTGYYRRAGHADDFATIREQGFLPVRAIRGGIVENIVPKRYRHIIDVKRERIEEDEQTRRILEAMRQAESAGSSALEMLIAENILVDPALPPAAGSERIVVERNTFYLLAPIGNWFGEVSGEDIYQRSHVVHFAKRKGEEKRKAKQRNFLNIDGKNIVRGGSLHKVIRPHLRYLIEVIDGQSTTSSAQRQ